MRGRRQRWRAAGHAAKTQTPLPRVRQRVTTIAFFARPVSRPTLKLPRRIRRPMRRAAQWPGKTHRQGAHVLFFSTQQWGPDGTFPQEKEATLRCLHGVLPASYTRTLPNAPPRCRDAALSFTSGRPQTKMKTAAPFPNGPIGKCNNKNNNNSNNHRAAWSRAGRVTTTLTFRTSVCDDQRYQRTLRGELHLHIQREGEEGDDTDRRYLVWSNSHGPEWGRARRGILCAVSTSQSSKPHNHYRLQTKQFTMPTRMVRMPRGLFESIWIRFAPTVTQRAPLNGRNGGYRSHLQPFQASGSALDSPRIR